MNRIYRLSRLALFPLGLCITLVLVACTRSHGSQGSPSPPAVGGVGGSRSSSKTLKSPGPAAGPSRAREHRRVLVGTLIANRKVVISPEIGGIIRRIYVSKGDYVKRRAPIMLVACQDYALMEAQVRSQVALAKAGLHLATTQRQYAERDFKRFSRLYREKTLSAYRLEKIRMGLALAGAQEALAQRRLQVAKVGLRMAKSRRSKCTTRAPFSGMVTNRMMDEGAMARSMPPSFVMVIEEITPIVIEVPIGEMYLKGLRHASRAVVLVPALGNRAVHRMTGKDLQAGLMPSINAHNRAATIRFKLPNRKRILKPGMTVELSIFQSGLR